jgi:hypothetical protein
VPAGLYDLALARGRAFLVDIPDVDAGPAVVRLVDIRFRPA